MPAPSKPVFESFRLLSVDGNQWSQDPDPKRMQTIIQKAIDTADPHLVCLQRDSSHEKHAPYLESVGYTLVSSCGADPGPLNSIWVRRTHALAAAWREEPLEFKTLTKCGEPRCTAAIYFRGLTVINLHTCAREAQAQPQDEERKRMQKILDWYDPDLIVGDQSSLSIFSSDTLTKLDSKPLLYRRGKLNVQVLPLSLIGVDMALTWMVDISSSSS